jgi:hypothetical protein
VKKFTTNSGAKPKEKKEKFQRRAPSFFAFVLVLNFSSIQPLRYSTKGKISS